RTPGAHPVAVISHGLWQRRFGGDPNILGKSVRLNGHPFTVIGVAPARFTGTGWGRGSEIYIPTMMLGQVMPNEAHKLTSPRDNWLNLMGRLKSGIARAQAEAGLDIIALELRRDVAEKSRKRIFLADGSQGNTDRIRSLNKPLTFLAAT